MARVTWTPDARAQLDEIFDFIAVKNRNLAAAEKLLRAIADRARFFARQPRSGPPRSDLAEGVRCFQVGNYVAFYRIVHGGIEVLVVTHGARDVPRLFRKSSSAQEEE